MKYFFLLFLIFFSEGIFCQQMQSVDFKEAKATVSIYPKDKSVQGNVTYTFEVLKNVDSIFIDAKDMEFADVKLNGKKADFFNDGERLWILSDFQKSTNNTLRFNYKAFPEQSMYFIDWQDSLKPNKLSVNQVWTQGQGKKTSYWLPSFDDANEKVEFDLSFNFKKGYELISNGKFIDKVQLNDSIVRWKYEMNHPMSSYLVAVAAGNYDKTELESSSGVPIYLYYYPEKENLVEPTYRYSKQIFDFLVQEIGVPFPWKNYKQIPVRDFLYSGMENTTATIFSDIFITDSIGFKDRNYVMVNAHELAHQWFGDMVTAVSDKHHWLQEGFATYFALLAEKEIFGDDYFYWKLYESAERLKSRSDIGKGEAVLSAGGNSLTYYQKGAWALHILREKIGEKAFKEGIRNYLKEYKYENVTTRNFISEMEMASGEELSGFVSKWLEQSAFQAYEALNSLRKSDFIVNYLKIAALKELPLEGKKELLSRALDFPVNNYIGQEVVYQLALENPLDVMDLYEKAFATNNIFVRQAIAVSMDSIPKELKSEYESLLEDESYLTREIAFYNLWMNFPNDRTKYLEKMKGIKGFSDKNIRILWLALNLATPTYNPESKQKIYDELAGYTAPNYSFQIRRNAFKYLFQLRAFNDKTLKNLLNATRHHTSRFQKFAKEMVMELLKNEDFRLRFQRLENLPPEQQEFLERELAQEKEMSSSK